MPDISFILTFHAEGVLAAASIAAAKRSMAEASANGLSVEAIATLDAPTLETERVVRASLQGTSSRVLMMNERDVGMTRNLAIAECRGDFICLCDGDDLLSANFVSEAHALAHISDREDVFRPELVIHFGVKKYLYWQVSSTAATFDPRCMLVVNPWTSACLSHRSTFSTIPYWGPSRSHPGYGFEDWHWNCDVIASGRRHLVTPQTIHYVRMKQRESLNLENLGKLALMPPSHLFDITRLPQQ